MYTGCTLGFGPYTTLDVQRYLTRLVRGVYIGVVMHLSDYMQLHQLSDEAVAAAIGRSRVSVSRYRRRLIRPDWDAAERIRDFTGGAVSADDWLDAPASAPDNEIAESEAPQ